MNVEKTAGTPGNVPEPIEGSGNSVSGWAPEQWVDRHGDFLYDYAMMRLRDPAAAQDAVQETFLAALRGQNAFRGLSEERGWLMGILKHKSHDHFRKTTRQPCFSDLDSHDAGAADGFQVDGLRKGAWADQSAPADWPAEPGHSLDQEAFWQVFHLCASKLPRQTARAFLLREMDDLGSEQICALLGISQNHLWVLLHRARLALRRCLEINWFTKQNE